VKSTEELPPFITVSKACDVAGGCCQATMYNMMGRGQINAVKMGGRTLINTKSLIDYLSDLPDAKITTGRPRKHSLETVSVNEEAMKANWEGYKDLSELPLLDKLRTPRRYISNADIRRLLIESHDEIVILRAKNAQLKEIIAKTQNDNKPMKEPS
jgi:hypothetical protein